jgi:hypothetical protein
MGTAGDPHVVMIEAKFRVNPRRMSATEQRATPVAMYGLLRPKRDLELSAMTPARRSAINYGDGERRLVGQTNERLNDETGEGSSDEDEGH